MAKKYQKSVFFHRQNSQKSEKNPAKTAKNCRNIRSKTFLKGGADRAGPILKGRAAGSSGPPIFRGGWAVAAVIGAALSSLKVVAGCCRFAAGGWCRAGRRCRAGRVAAGRWLSILYGVGCHRWRWAALSILYSSKVGRGVGHRAGRSRCSRAAGLSCCEVRRVVIGAAPISQGTPSPGRRSILYGSKVGRGVGHRAGRSRCSRAAGLSLLQGAPHGHRGRSDLPGRRAGCDPRSSGRRCCPVCAGSMPGTGGGCTVPAADVPAPRVQPEPFQIIRQAQNAQKAGRAVWPVLPFVFVRSGFIRCRRGHLLRAA